MQRRKYITNCLLAVACLFTFIACEDVVFCNNEPFKVKLQFYGKYPSQTKNNQTFDRIKVLGSDSTFQTENKASEYLIPLNPNSNKSTLVLQKFIKDSDEQIKSSDTIEISYIVKDSIISPECGAAHRFHDIKLERYTKFAADTIIISQDPFDPLYNDTSIEVYNYKK